MMSLDRSIPPPFQKNLDFKLLEPERGKLSSGAHLLFISGGQQNVIRLELVFSSGKWYETKPGASYFTGNMLNKGTRTKTSFQIAEGFDLYGAHVEIHVNNDTISISLYTLTKYIEPTLDLLLEMLTEPAFNERELEQLKLIYLQNLKINQEKTAYMASVLFREALFGESHPYGKEPGEKEVEAISSADLTEHHKAHDGDFFVIVAGKVDEPQKKIIAAKLEALSYQPHVPSNGLSFPEPMPGRLVKEKPGALQSSLRVGKYMVNRMHPHYFKLVFLHHLLGGFFGSRLMKNIREEKGLTYGIHASLQTLQHAAYCTIATDVNKDQVDVAFNEISNEIARLSSEPVPVDELELAKNHFIGSLQSEITTPFAHADKWKTILLFQLPEQYYPNLVYEIANLRADELMSCAATHMKVEAYTQVAAG